MKVKGLLANIVCGCIGLGLSIYVWVATTSFPAATATTTIGSDFFPRLLAFGLACSSICMMAIAAISKKDEIFESIDIRQAGIQRAIVCCISTFVYAFCISRIGFIISSMVYLFCMMFVLKNRSWMKMALVSVILPIAVSLIFEKLLGILLPLGILKNILY